MKNSVLIVDDMEADRYIARWAIKQKAFADTILEASDGQEAIDLFRNFDESRKAFGEEGFPPTVILLDINMPRMNGFEFLDEFEKEMKNREASYSSIVVMVFSSSHLKSERDKALSYSFVKGFLEKPITPDDIAEIAATTQL